VTPGFLRCYDSAAAAQRVAAASATQQITVGGLSKPKTEVKITYDYLKRENPKTSHAGILEWVFDDFFKPRAAPQYLPDVAEYYNQLRASFKTQFETAYPGLDS